MPAAGPQLEDAVRALDAGRAVEVRPFLEQTSATRSSDTHVWALLARTYWTLRDPAKAKAAAERAERGNPSPEAQHALALYYAQSGNRKRAAVLEGMYAASPKADPLASTRAAMLHFETGGFAEAVRFGLRSPSDRPDVLLLLARSYEALKQPDAALLQYEALLRLRPYEEDSHSQLAQALLRAGRFNDAVSRIETSLRTFDKSPQLELALGVAYYGQRRFSDAGKRFLRVIDLDPSIEQPYVFLAKMIDQLEPMLPEITVKFAAWHRAEQRNHYAAFVYSKVAPPEETEALLREAIRRQPAFWESHFDLAAVLERKRDFAGAAQELEQSAKLSPQEPAVQYRLSRVYTRLGQSEKAAQARARHEKLTASK